MGWETKQNLKASTCGFIDADITPVVIMDYKVKDKINALLEHFDRDEWLACLIGQVNPENMEFTVKDLHIPEQVVTSASVDVTDTTLPAHVIGTVHSHHNMSPFLSHTDEEDLMGNSEVTIVVAHNGWTQRVRRRLPCGHYLEMDASLQIQRPLTKGLEKFVTDSLPKITKRTYTPTSSTSFTNSGKKCPICSEFKTWADLNWNKTIQSTICTTCEPKVDLLTPKQLAEVKQRANQSHANRQCGTCDQYFIWSQVTWQHETKDWICDGCRKLLAKGEPDLGLCYTCDESLGKDRRYIPEFTDWVCPECFATIQDLPVEHKKELAEHIDKGEYDNCPLDLQTYIASKINNNGKEGRGRRFSTNPDPTDENPSTMYTACFVCSVFVPTKNGETLKGHFVCKECIADGCDEYINYLT